MKIVKSSLGALMQGVECTRPVQRCYVLEVGLSGQTEVEICNRLCVEESIWKILPMAPQGNSSE